MDLPSQAQQSLCEDEGWEMMVAFSLLTQAQPHRGTLFFLNQPYLTAAATTTTTIT